MSEPLDAAGAPPTAASADCRCLCGSLLARVIREGVELKCRRCKRTLLVPLPASWRARPLGPLPVHEVG